MPKSGDSPLIRARTKLSPIDSHAVGTFLLSVGGAATGNLISTWVWKRFVEPRKKGKRTVARRFPDGSVRILELESIEERIIKKRKLRLIVKNR